MVLIKNIKIKNFLSHSDTVIDLAPGQKVLLDGKSGSGKSSVLDGIIWCLYGESRGDNRNLVKKGSKSATVELTLVSGDILYKIERSTTDKGKNSLSILECLDGVNFTPVAYTGLKDAQNWIEETLLKASYTLFINSIAYPQDNTNNFVKQTAAKRKDLLLEIASVKDFDLYYSRAKGALDLKNEERIRLLAEIESNESMSDALKIDLVDEEKTKGEIQALEKDLEVCKEKLNKLEHDLADAFSAEENIKNLYVREETQKDEENEINNDIKIKETLLADLKKIDIKDLKKKALELRQKEEEKESLSKRIHEDYERSMKINALMADKPIERDYESEIADLNKRLIPLIKNTSVCPAGDGCPFVKPFKDEISHYEEMINQKKEKMNEQAIALKEYQIKLAALGAPSVTEEERTRYGILEKEIKALEGVKEWLAKAESSLDRIPSIESELEALRGRLVISEKRLAAVAIEIAEQKKLIEQKTNLNHERGKFLNSINGITGKISYLVVSLKMSINARERISKMASDSEEKRKKLQEVDLSIKALLSIKEAFGSKGLKAVAVDYLIPRLEDKINEILSQLSDFRVRLDTQKSTASGEGTVEGLYINIINDRGEELDYSNYSGGEKLKITVAISEALASLQRVGFRILDELFVGLDEESTENFAMIMGKLNERFSQMLCISHLRNIKDIFEEKIFISKVNGTSIVQK